MLPYFILGIALLLGTVLILQGLARADPKKLVFVLKWTAAAILGAGVLYLAFKGRLGYAASLLPLLAPVFLRWRHVARMAKSFAGPRPGQTSGVETEYLGMSLDHDTGEMSGRVLKGVHAGRRLDELSLDELLDLLAACRAADPRSVTILEAYLDRKEGPEWRERAAEGAAAGAGEAGRGAARADSMTREEALEILGLEPGASRKEIKEAYRRLMSRLHPDQGGSNYLAAKINLAKEVLLGA